MRLWLTRDGAGSRSTFAWVAEQAPTLHGQQWVHDGDVHSVSKCDYDIAPGTCTELFTEQQVRQMLATSGELLTMAHAIEQSKLFTERQVREQVSMVATKAFAIESIYCAAVDYRDDPTDDNWSRLMAEVGAGGGA